MSALAQVAPVLAENSLFKEVGNIFHPLFELVATVLAFIYGIVPNYALAIIILTVLIMAILTPLTIKSTKSMLAMQALQPEMQKLRQKYKGAENREQLNQEMMRLYREQGVSPMGGCLPMFLQMPALVVLYDTIRGLANTIPRGTKFPSGTLLPLANAVTVTGRKVFPPGLVHHGTVLVAGLKCKAALCAAPRYIPSGSKMYHHLIATPGVMKSFGMNFALKPLTHHTNWWDYIPYLALVAIAVALQYIQMNQMTKRNKAAAQMNNQMQKMQKIMPLIFAYIYFLIPGGVVIYMIVSSAIRILTQDLIFRTGIVQRPGEREIGTGGAGGKKATTSGPPGGASSLPAVTAGKAAGGAGGTAGSGARKSGPGGSTPGRSGGGARSGRPGGVNGSRTSAGAKGGTNGAAAGSTGAGAKSHPRSKSKRARKAR